MGKRLFPGRYLNGSFVGTWAVIGGVIEDIRDRSPSQASSGQVFWPFAQSARWELTYVVRTEGDPNALADEARATVAALHRDLAVSDVRVMDDYVATAMAPTRFVVLLAGVFSTLAIVLAALGLYSVITYNTTQQSHELGVRIALGAGSRDILTGATISTGTKGGMLSVPPRRRWPKTTRSWVGLTRTT